MPSYQNDKAEKAKPDDDRRDNVSYWIRWLKRARKASECHWQDADQAWDEYENGKSSKASDDRAKAQRCYPAYYTCSKFMESALYSRDPQPKSKRKFGTDDEYALTQQLIADRLGQTFIEISNFGEAMRGSRDNLIHADKAANQVIVDYDLSPGQKQRRDLMMTQGEDGTSQYQDGEDLYNGEVFQDETGYYYESDGEPTITNPKFSVKPIQYDEFLHTPDAKADSEIVDDAFFFCLDEADAKTRFADIKNLPFRVSKSAREGEKDSSDDQNNYSKEKYLCGWEIYCKHTNMVYWVCEEYPDDFLDKKPIDEVTKLRRKIPRTPFIINSKPRKSLFPTPVFKQLEPTINQLHRQYNELMLMVEAARPRFVVNTDNDDVITALEDLRGLMFIKAKNFHDILEKGGLNSLIQQIPVDGIVSSMSQLISLEETFRTNMSEWFGTPDIVKGVSETEKTRGEVEIEHGAAYDRFRYIKKQIETLARDTLEMGIDLMLDIYPDDEIAKICGWEFMERGKPGVPAQPPSEENPQGVPEVPPTMGHYERFPIALQQLKDDQQRLVRIDIQTDSTSFTNEMKEMQRRQQIFSTVLEGLSTIGGMQNQQFMMPVAKAFMGVLEAIGGAVMEEDAIKSALKELEEARNQPPPPPPPDYTQLKVEAQMQGNQIKAQKDQMDNAVAMRELDRKEYETGLKEKEILFNQQMEAVKLQLEQALVELESNRVAIEEFKAKTQADEGKLEEMRLALEQIQAQESTETEAEPEPKAMPPPPAPTIVVVDGNKGGGSKRTATIGRNGKGEISHLVFDSATDE